MGDFSIIGGDGGKAEAWGLTGSRPLAVQPSATIHTKGSYVELIASTGFDYTSITLVFGDRDPDLCFADIAVGSAGNEEVIISNYMIGSTSDGAVTFTSGTCAIPISIPAGSRVSARTQGGNSSMNGPRIGGIGYSGSFSNSAGLVKVSDVGSVIGSTGGTVIDPGSSANTKGSWVELTSSSSESYAGFLLSLNHNRDTTPEAGQFLLDVAIGSSGNEEIIFPDYFFSSDSNDVWCNMHIPSFIPIAIPSGTRIAVRAQASITDAGNRVFGCTFYGVS